MPGNKKLIIIISVLISTSLLGCSSELKQGPVKKPSSKEDNNTKPQTKYKQETSVQLEFDEYSIVFGFSSTNGIEILAISDTLPDPVLYTHTISIDNKLIPLLYKGEKSGDEEKEFQQVYSNFANCGGYLFETGLGKVDYKKVNILLTDKFLEGRKYICDFSQGKDQLDKDILLMLEETNGKKVKNSFLIIKVDKKGSLFAVNYEISNDSTMFSFVFVEPNKLVIKDNFGEYDPAGTWRFGDKGYVKPDMFDVLAVFESKYGIEFAIDWIGSEGDYIEYLIENGNVLEMTKNEYRYTLPN